MSLGLPVPDECRLLPSVSVDPSPADYQQLQELLQQALKREADALRKINHLHQQLMARDAGPRSDSGSARTDTPEPCHWELLDNMHSELSQTSLGSPGTPPPALVVSGSPSISRAKSKSQPSTPIGIPITSAEQMPGSSLVTSISKSQGALVLDRLSNGHASEVHVVNESWHIPSSSIDAITSPPPTSPEIHLMPTLTILSDDVRKEREKPPTTNSSEHKRTTSLARDILATTSTAMPPSINPPLSTSPTTCTSSLQHHQHSTSLEGLSVVGSAGTREQAPPIDQQSQATKATKSKSLGRTSSTKTKNSKGGGGYRSRSNSAFQVPNWLKKKRGSTAGAGAGRMSLSGERAYQTTDSIEQLFQAFTRAASIRIDPLAQYIDHHWSEVCADSSCSPEVKKYREAVWDMFQSEAKYLAKFLQPLELVYKTFLEELHFHQILKVADVDKIFANLSELCELSSDVANNLFSLFHGRHGNKIAPVSELIKAFSMFGHKFNPVYQRFCVNYEKQQGFVRALQQLPDFQVYQNVCRGHSVVGKNDLPALLIAPMQHQCRYQLKLDQVLKYTQVPAEKELLSSTIKAFVVSLKELEANINEHKRSAELLELQETLYWPSVAQLHPDAYVSDSLREQLSRQPCCELLASKDRQLVDKGCIRLLDSKGRPTTELQVYLFTDILLMTEEHRPTKKEGHNQLVQYRVYGHPVSLASVEVFEVDSPKHCLTLVERTQLHQRIRMYTLQTSSKEDRKRWVGQVQRIQDLLWRRHQDNIIESDV